MEQASLEAIVLHLDADGIRNLSPHGRETVRAPWKPDQDPTESIVDARLRTPAGAVQDASVEIPDAW